MTTPKETVYDTPAQRKLIDETVRILLEGWAATRHRKTVADIADPARLAVELALDLAFERLPVGTMRKRRRAAMGRYLHTRHWIGRSEAASLELHRTIVKRIMDRLERWSDAAEAAADDHYFFDEEMEALARRRIGGSIAP